MVIYVIIYSAPRYKGNIDLNMMTLCSSFNMPVIRDGHFSLRYKGHTRTDLPRFHSMSLYTDTH